MQTKMSRRAAIITLFLASMLCGCQSKVEIIDLNKVLKVFDETVKKRESDDVSKSEKVDLTAKENVEDTKAFLVVFADGLNKAKLGSAHLGVDMLLSGSIEGFKDRNKNRKKDGAEAVLFTIQFDAEGKRVIASQKVGSQVYRRDHHYSHGYHRYYYYHYLYSSMSRRQNSYYGHGSSRGTSGQARPNYNTMPMSTANYHSSAVNKATATRSRSARASSSARSYGGSRSFSSGK
jgi:hypothetical protein